MSEPLTLHDLELIAQSLEYTAQAFERYAYPTNEVKRGRLDEIDQVRAKIIAMKRQAKKQA